MKQADVVALLALLPQEFPSGTGATNFHYYEARCGHGSSLSPAMHALVAARLGEDEMALSYFEKTASIDLRDTHAAIGGGIHVAAQGGLWMTAVFGFAGLSVRDDGLAIEPHLPATWTTVRFSVGWRGRRLDVAIDALQHQVEIAVEPGPPMHLCAAGTKHAFDGERAVRRIDMTTRSAVAGTAAL